MKKKILTAVISLSAATSSLAQEATPLIHRDISELNAHSQSVCAALLLKAGMAFSLHQNPSRQVKNATFQTLYAGYVFEQMSSSNDPEAHAEAWGATVGDRENDAYRNQVNACFQLAKYADQLDAISEPIKNRAIQEATQIVSEMP